MDNGVKVTRYSVELSVTPEDASLLKFTELSSKSDHFTQFPDRDEKDDTNIINLDTTEVSSETTNWTSVMGNLGVLIDNLKDCNDIYKKYCKEELVNEKFAAIEIVNATSPVVEMSKKI